MSEFNENPFLKDTQVSIFSNATEAEWWQTNNCHQCKKYECESQTEEKAKCKLAFYIDMGFVVNTIPLWVAKEVGCKYDPLYQSAELNKKCKQIQDENYDPNMPF